MKEKKNKRKQNRKILPVVLVIVMLVSMLAVSASAAEPECGCYDDDPFSVVFFFRRSEVKDYWILECDSCHVLRYFYEAGSFERFTGYEVDSSLYHGVEDSLTVGMCGGDEGLCVDFNPMRVDGLPSNVPEATGGIVATIAKDVTSAVGVFLKGIGSTLTNFFDNVVVTTNAEGQRVLSTFAGWTLAFVGIGFGAGLLRKLLKKAN